MSLVKYYDKVKENDIVIFYFGYDNMYVIIIKKGFVFQIRYGVLRYNDIIGMIYGS